jgi:hypothetical protein
MTRSHLSRAFALGLVLASPAAAQTTQDPAAGQTVQPLTTVEPIAPTQDQAQQPQAPAGQPAQAQPAQEPAATQPAQGQAAASQPAQGQTTEQEELPDWLPQALVPPAEFSIVRVAEVGSTNRLLLLEMPGDPVEVFEHWRAALRETNYTLDAQSETLGEENRIVFSGQGIRSGQIVLMPGTAAENSLVQIDATLDQ